MRFGYNFVLCPSHEDVDLKFKKLIWIINWFNLTWAVNSAVEGLADVISGHDDVDLALGAAGAVVVLHSPVPRVGDLGRASPPAHLFREELSQFNKHNLQLQVITVE